MEQSLIGVVIPYFQREPGILRRALASVLRQRGVEQVAVVVVDDASPVPASAEVASLGETQARRNADLRTPVIQSIEPVLELLGLIQRVHSDSVSI